MASETASRGSVRELLRLAWPLIVTNSFFTLQIFIDRIFLESTPAATDVGAGLVADHAVLGAADVLAVDQQLRHDVRRPVRRRGTICAASARSCGSRCISAWPAVWPSCCWHRSPDYVVGIGHHSADLQALEMVYFRCLCFSALPLLITASACCFFAGRGASRVVLFINATGLCVNGVSAYALIFGRMGLPGLGHRRCGGGDGAGQQRLGASSR